MDISEHQRPAFRGGGHAGSAAAGDAAHPTLWITPYGDLLSNLQQVWVSERSAACTRVHAFDADE
jgi:hypothetical protein